MNSRVQCCVCGLHRNSGIISESGLRQMVGTMYHRLDIIRNPGHWDCYETTHHITSVFRRYSTWEHTSTSLYQLVSLHYIKVSYNKKIADASSRDLAYISNNWTTILEEASAYVFQRDRWTVQLSTFSAMSFLGSMNGDIFSRFLTTIRLREHIVIP